MINVDNTDVQRDLVDVPIFAARSEWPNNMDPSKQEKGVIPLETLPAEHYNFLFGRETLRFNNLFKCVKNMLSEFKNLLFGIGGITPSDNPAVTNQVQAFFNTNYPNTTIPSKVAAAADIQPTDIDSQQGKSCAFAAEKTANGTSSIAKVTPPIPVFLGGTGASNAGDAAFNVLAGTPTATLDGTESVLLQTSTGLIRKVGLGDLVAHMFDRMIPVGTVVWYLGPLTPQSIPNGWLICDGKIVYRETKYDRLVNLLSDPIFANLGQRVRLTQEYFSIDFRGLSLMGAERIGDQTQNGSVMGEYQNDATKANGLSISGTAGGSFDVRTLLQKIYINNQLSYSHSHQIQIAKFGALTDAGSSEGFPVISPAPEFNTVDTLSADIQTTGSLSLDTLNPDPTTPVTMDVSVTGISLGSGDSETRAKNVRGAFLIKY